MRRTVVFSVLWLALAGLTETMPAAGQAVGITTVQGLRFGTLIPGASQRVTATDEGRAEVVVSTRGRITVVVNLPTELTSSAGSEAVPVSFDASDGRYRIGTGQLQPFDPRSPLTVTIPGNAGTLTIMLGGAVDTASNQSSGAYGAMITVQVIAG